MIDTHCHIYLEHFDDDLEQVLDRAAGAGVEQILMPAINFGSLKQMERLSHPRLTFHRMAGIHPTSINEGVFATEDKLLARCRTSGIVAVGETGLDYHWSAEHKSEQQESLRLHCRVAKAVGKPIVLHNRASTDDLLDIVEQEQDGTLSGVWHCFNGSEDEGKRAMDLGLMLGIGGVLTFKNAGIDETVAKLPIDKMILETDAPYLAPEPVRGKRNEPSFIRHTAQKLGEVLDMGLEEVAGITSSNARHLFALGG